MTERITQNWIDKRLALVNKLLNRPETMYTKTKDGKLSGNLGNLHFDHTYGGVSINEMCTDGGGVNDISGRGTKREINQFLDGMLAAIRLNNDNPRAGK